MTFDGQPDEPTARPASQSNPRSPYGQAAPQSPSWAQQSPSGYPQQPPPPPRQPTAHPQPQWPGFDGPATEVFDPAVTTTMSPAAGPSRPRGPGGPGAPGGPGGPGGTGRKGWRSPKVLVPGAIGLVLLLGAGGLFAVNKLRGVQVEDAPDGTPSATGAAATMPPGRTWLSGAWTGGGISVERIDDFGTWRGQPADVVTTYPAYNTWKELKESDWHVGTLDDFKGRLSYGLPLLPKKDAGTLADVAAGKHDDVFTAIAEILNKHHREDTFVRIGLEANGTWFPWGAKASEAEDYKAAWRHVQSVMKAVSPKLVFGFDITCGKALEGGSDRLDNLTKLYPGDDVVDVVGCDHYDSYTVKSRNADEWASTLKPENAGGLADVATFARQHHKKLAIPEWGLTSKKKDGAGDNTYFIYAMYNYFLQNKDILLYENYFNEADDSLGSAVWDSTENPKAAAEYKKLWGAAPNLTQTTG